jgi:cytochrome c oxidase assembly protein subunit 15
MDGTTISSCISKKKFSPRKKTNEIANPKEMLTMTPSLPSVSTQNHSLFFWLSGTCFLIWLMIILGGATRLTHAGLSIVEWKPITGIIPPLTEAQWQEAFENYKQYPEYKLVNQGMALSSFQFIYFMEYAHRLLGRLVGLWFILPLVIFWRQGSLSVKLKQRSLIALVLGLSQGVMGWYMVKSGLVKDPNVSPYRLTTHLALAIALYGVLFWTVLEMVAAPLRSAAKRECAVIRWLSLASCAALGLTILYGGFVAGLKAGLIYNTFPLMEGQFTPGEWAFYHPVWINFFENAALVQWMHRWLASSAVVIILLTAWKTWRHSPNQHTRTLALLFASAALGQATLGVLTLLFHVPVILGTLHQGTAILVLSLGLGLCYFSSSHQSHRP